MSYFLANFAMFCISLKRKSFGKYVYEAIFSPLLKYNSFSFSVVCDDTTLLKRCQLSGLTLYVDAVICLIPIAVRVLIRVSGLSFTYGIIGSMRADTGMPSSIKILAVSMRFVGRGAFGSINLAILSSSVVIVNATVAAVRFRRSTSLVTKVDLVII